MVIGEELSRVVKILKENDNQNSVFEAHLIFRHFLNMSPMDLLLNNKKEIDSHTLEIINEAVLRRIKKEPLQYILNSQEFMGLDFYVDKNVLVPRADTETLVEHILSMFLNKSFTALDIGTGSGCIAVSLAHYNKKSYIRGIDISPRALEIAKKNAEDNGVADRVTFDQADIFTYKCYGKYELVVSNPPYIETDEIEKLDIDVKDYEPYNALDGGADGLDFYRHIIDISTGFLKKDGVLAFEVGINQAEAVRDLMKKSFHDIQIIKDLCGVDRVVSGIL